jgi:ABC-2 type transport system permease protein
MPTAASALVALHLRLAWRPASAWAVMFFAMVAASATAFEPAFPNVAARRELEAALTADRGIESLFGSARGIAEMPGFVQWRCTVLLATIGAVWAVLSTARMLRGAEDDGHAEVIDAQPLSRRTATACALTAQLILCAVLGVTTSAAALVGGIGAGRAALYGLALAMPAVTFSGVAALLAQAAPSRGRAAAWGGGAVALAFAVRVAADSSDGLRALSALSPLGWAERTTALTEPHPGWVALGLAFGAAAAGAALAVAPYRDIGSALWRTHRAAGRPPRTLTAAGAWGALAGWAAGLAAFCFMTGMISASVGSIARAGGQELSQDSAFADMFTPEGYLTTVLVMASMVVAVYGARAAVRAHEEEVAGRLGMVLAAPQHRGTWLAARIARGVVGAGLLLAVAGLGGWAGARTRGIDLSFGQMLGAGLAGLPQVLIFAGLATLAFGLRPRLTTALAYGGAGVAYLLALVGDAVRAPTWVTWLSPFEHASAAPLHPVDWGSLVAMSAIGMALLLAGVRAFAARDVATG